MRYPLVAALRVDRIFAMQSHATCRHRHLFRFKLGTRLVTPPYEPCADRSGDRMRGRHGVSALLRVGLRVFARGTEMPSHRMIT